MSSTSFEITPTDTFTSYDVEAIRGWDYDPSERHGVEYVICQDSPRGNRSSTFSRESIQTIVEALQAWLDEHAPKAYEVKVGDRVQLNADKALWVNGYESGTQPGRGALGTIQDGVDRQGDVWVYWDGRQPGYVNPALLLPAGEERMPDWERELLGEPEVKRPAVGDRVRVNAVKEGEYHYAPVGAEGVVVGPEVYAEYASPVDGLIVVQFDQPSEDYWGGEGRYDGKFQFLSPEQVDVINDREAAKAAHPSSQPAPAFAEGDRVRITGEGGRFIHHLTTGTEGVANRVDLWDDSVRVETDDDIQWVGFEQLEKVDAYSDEEREANGRLVFVNLGDYYDGDRLGIPVEALAGYVEERVESSDGNYIQTIYDPADFKPIEPTLPFGDGVIKAGDRVKIRTKKVSGDPRWTKVSESDWLEVKVNTRNELHADGRILAHDNVTILEHYPAAEREANDRLVFVAGYTVVSWADVPHSDDSVPAGGVNWYPVNLDPSDFHPIPEPEPLKVGDHVRIIAPPFYRLDGQKSFHSQGRIGEEFIIYGEADEDGDFWIQGLPHTAGEVLERV